jgi:short subunit dehydrogenase-like uncharacterized protein
VTTTTSEISPVDDGQVASDVLLLGAAGNSGRLIAAELTARSLSVRLAGRRRGPLEDLARALAADGAATDVRTVDVSDPASLAEVVIGVGVILSTIGPFTRQADPVIDACMATNLPYVDIANEWPAVRGLLDRDQQARGHAGHRCRVRAGRDRSWAPSCVPMPSDAVLLTRDTGRVARWGLVPG